MTGDEQCFWIVMVIVACCCVFLGFAWLCVGVAEVIDWILRRWKK